METLTDKQRKERAQQPRTVGVGERVIPSTHERADDGTGALRVVAMRLAGQPRDGLHGTRPRLTRGVHAVFEGDGFEVDAGHGAVSGWREPVPACGWYDPMVMLIGSPRGPGR